NDALQRRREAFDPRCADHGLVGFVLALDRLQVNALSAMAEILPLARAWAGDPPVYDRETSFDSHWRSSGCPKRNEPNHRRCTRVACDRRRVIASPDPSQLRALVDETTQEPSTSRLEDHKRNLAGRPLLVALV